MFLAEGEHYNPEYYSNLKHKAEELFAGTLLDRNSADFSTRIGYNKHSLKAWYLGLSNYIASKMEGENPELSNIERTRLGHGIEAQIANERRKTQEIEIQPFPILSRLDPTQMLSFRQSVNAPQKYILDDTFYEARTDIEVTDNLYGLEVEVGFPPDNIQIEPYLESLDYTTQALGLMICADSLREIRLPPSSSLKQQLAGFAELMNLGLILEEQEVNTHVNTSEIPNPEDHLKELLLICLAIDSSDIFGTPDPDFELTITASKPLFADTKTDSLPTNNDANNRFNGFPIRIKAGDITEFRLLQKHWNGFPEYYNGILVFRNIIKALSGHIRTQDNPSTASAQDQHLSELWSNFYANLSRQFSTEMYTREGIKLVHPIEKELDAMVAYIKLVRTYQKNLSGSYTNTEQVNEALEEFLAIINAEGLEDADIEKVLEKYRDVYKISISQGNDNYFNYLSKTVASNSLRNPELRYDINSSIRTLYEEVDQLQLD